jgi:hypothetical protein
MKNNYNICKNLKQDQCVIWSGCDGCYYFKLDELICPYCQRKMPNLQFKYKKGCKWCQK